MCKYSDNFWTMKITIHLLTKINANGKLLYNYKEMYTFTNYAEEERNN